jgi:hypothetical protein
VAARKRKDQGIVALQLAELSGDPLMIGQLVVGERGARLDVITDGELLSLCSLAVDEPLPAVDVVGGTRDRGIDHEVNGERCYVSRSDHPANGELRAQLFAPGLESLAQERSRQGSVDEAGGDHVDPDRRELERSKNRFSAAASVASKAAVLIAPSSTAASAGVRDSGR